MPTHDSQLPSRQYLIDQSNKLLPMARRHKFPVSLIKFEIDDQLEIESHNEQDTIDEIVQCIAILLRSTSRQEDTIVKYSNLKFAILLPYCTISSAVEKSERIRKDICNLKPDLVEITASFGVSGASEDGSGSWESMIAAAHNALEQAKAEGGNRVRYENSD